MSSHIWEISEKSVESVVLLFGRVEMGRVLLDFVFTEDSGQELEGPVISV